MSIIKVKNDYDDAECEASEPKYYQKYLEAIKLLRKAHQINKAFLFFITPKDLEVMQKLNKEIEDII